MPVLVFFRHDEPIFGTKELVSSLGPVNRDSPVIHAHCVLAYNQTEGMMDVELGFSVGDGPRQVTTMKGIPLPDFPQSNRMKLDAWHPTRFWMDTIVLENELGTYEVEE